MKRSFQTKEAEIREINLNEVLFTVSDTFQDTAARSEFISKISKANSGIEAWKSIVLTTDSLVSSERAMELLVQFILSKTPQDKVGEMELLLDFQQQKSSKTQKPMPLTDEDEQRELWEAISVHRTPGNRNAWGKQESEKLTKLVNEHDKFTKIAWKSIAKQLGTGRTAAQCAQRWKRVIDPEITKGSWNASEEELLLQLVRFNSKNQSSDLNEIHWNAISEGIKGRTDLQCRYQAKRAIESRKVVWNETEDKVLLSLMSSLKLKEDSDENCYWISVAKHLGKYHLTKIPRTALECKNRIAVLNSQIQQEENPKQQETAN